MRSAFVLISLILLLPILALAQGNSYQPQLLTGVGAPGTGALQTCAVYQQYLDTSTGNYWWCKPDSSGAHGAWVNASNPSSLDNIIFVDGVTNTLDSPGLTKACTTAGSNGTVGITKPIVMTASVTCAAAVQVFDGGSFTTTGWTLTLSNALTAGFYQIFFGTGTVSLSTLAASNGVIPQWFPGSEPGAQFNAGYAAMPSTGGLFTPGLIQANQTTTANFNVAGKCVTVRGVGGQASYLGWTGSSLGTMFNFDCASGTNQHATGFGIEKMYLQTSGVNTATAVNFGNTNSGQGGQVTDSTIVGFNAATVIQGGGNASFNISWMRTVGIANGVCVDIGPNSTGAENTQIFGGLCIAATIAAIRVTGASNSSDWRTVGMSFDSTAGGGVDVLMNGSCAANGTIDSPHHENPSLATPTYIQLLCGTLTEEGGIWDDDVTSGTNANPWGSCSGGNFFGFGIQLHSSGRTTNVPLISQTGSCNVFIQATTDTPSLFTGNLPLFAAAAVTSGNAQGSLTTSAGLGKSFFSNVGGGLAPSGTALGDTWASRGTTSGVEFLGSDGNCYFLRSSGNVLLNSSCGYFQFSTPLAVGTQPAITGTGACATVTTPTGGQWNGTIKCTGTTGASTLTITPGFTAPNGFNCTGTKDETTPANVLNQTSHAVTSCTLTASSITQNDVILIEALGF